MSIYDPRNPRNPRSPLELARDSGQSFVREAEPQGVRLAEPIEPAGMDTGPGRIGNGGSNVRDPYGQQLSALQQGIQNMPQQMQQYRDQRNAATDAEAQLHRDYISGLQPERSQWAGRLGAQLLAPTKTGSFFEAYGNAVNAALDQRDYESKQRAALAEKKYRAELGLANLMANKVANPMDEMRNQFTLLDTGQKVDELQADYDLRRDLAGGLTPQTPDALLSDYRTNPQKYRSPRGQAMVDDARTQLADSAKAQDERDWWLQQKQIESQFRREEEALKAQAPQPLDRAESNRIVKRKSELMSAADGARDLEGQISALKSARDRIQYEGRPGSSIYSNWFGWASNNAATGQEVESNATRLKLEISQKLKGSVSNSEQDMLQRATPGLSMSDTAANNVIAGYEASTQRAKERSKFYETYVRASGNDYGEQEAWDTFVTDNPILSEGEDGSLIVNRNNVSAWRAYIPQSSGEAGNAPAQRAPRPGYDYGATDFSRMPNGTVIEDEDGNQFIINGGKPQPWGGQ